MARKKLKKIVSRRKQKVVKRNSAFSGFKLPSSYTSLILGALVVLVLGILFVVFAKGNKITQTSSTNEGPTSESQMENKNTSSSYTIKPGDDLWSISENIYDDGYKWVEIAKANKIENPGIIIVGNKLIIPQIEKKASVVAQENKPNPEPNKIAPNNAINDTKYTIKEGDNLWDICVRAYGDGYKWPEIAKVNNLENPSLIYPNNVLTLPR